VTSDLHQAIDRYIDWRAVYYQRMRQTLLLPQATRAELDAIEIELGAAAPALQGNPDFPPGARKIEMGRKARGVAKAVLREMKGAT